MIITEEPEETEPIQRLSRDLLDAARLLSQAEVRYIVDGYYQMQKYRQASANQVRSMAVSGEPTRLLSWLEGNTSRIEGQIKRAMQAWSEEQLPGRWALSQVGIGPVLAAGLLAHIDIMKAPAVSHIWRFAGLDPTLKWLGKENATSLMREVADLAADWDEDEADPYALTPAQFGEYQEIIVDGSGKQLNSRQIAAIAKLTNRKFGNLLRIARDEEGRVTAASMTAALAKRPYNAKLKLLCWKVGDSFVKQSSHPRAVYGHIYQERKALEIERNMAGRFADQAQEALGRRLTPHQRTAYEQGQLPDGRIDLRARRYAVKLFLSHLHHVMFESAFGRPPPKTYPMAELGHTDYMPPPNWPMA